MVEKPNVANLRRLEFEKRDEIAQAEALASDETVRDLTDEEREAFFKHVFKGSG